MGNTAALGFASRDCCRVGEPGLMLVELSVVEQRYHAVMEVISGGIPVVEVAERYGVSRKTVHAWLRRYRRKVCRG
jgi:DNA-binding NarL/FixJ family response regulator